VFVKKLKDCEAFTAIDGCRIRELLHPDNDPVVLDYSIAIASLEAGESTFKHRLLHSEVYFILAGQGRMHIGDEDRLVDAGDVIYIPPRSIQWIENTGRNELQFAAIVSPPWRAADDELLEE